MRIAFTVFAVSIAAVCGAAPLRAEEPAPPATFASPEESFNAKDILPPELLSGEGFTVDEKVGLEGYQYRFEIRSDWGVYHPVSMDMLRTRIQEIAVLEHTEKLSGSKEFANSLKNNLVQIPVSASKFFTEPGQSFKNVGVGVKNKFLGIGRLFSGREKSQYEDSTLNEMASGAQKRELAVQLGVDVYSSNPQIQRLLTHIARLRATGAAPIKIGSFFAPTGVGAGLMVLELRRDVSKDLRNKSPSELHAINNKILKKLKIEDKLKDAFLDNRVYSPRHKTTICANLAELDDVDGIEHFLESTTQDESEEEALFAERQSDMLLCYHKKFEKLEQLVLLGRIPVAITRGGTMLIIGPADYLHRTEETPAVLKELERIAHEKRVKNRKVVITGSIEEGSKARLIQAGYNCVEHFLMDVKTK
jgi:hypothetical protein